MPTEKVVLPRIWKQMTLEEQQTWCDSHGYTIEQVNNPNNMHVTLDTTAIADMAKENEKLKADLENAKTKLTIISEQSFAEKLEKAGNPVGITTVEGLKAYVEAQAQKDKGDDPIDYARRTGVGAGQIGLSGNLGNNSEGYESEKEMIDDLHNKSAAGNVNADKILKRMMLKTWTGRKEQPHMLNAEFSGEINELTNKETGIVEQLNEKFRETERMRRKQKGDNDD